MAFSSRDLALGDILITPATKIVSHCGVVAGNVEVGQGLQKTEKPGMIYHATGGGILADVPGTWIEKRGVAGVFRLTHAPGGAGQQVAAAATAMAERGKNGKPRTSYSIARAGLMSWTGTSTFGVSAKGRLYKYMARLGMGNQPFITEVYCSEYVVLSYQLASKGNEASPLFIDLDGKHTLPKDLRNWLLQRTQAGGTWSYLGEMTG